MPVRRNLSLIGQTRKLIHEPQRSGLKTHCVAGYRLLLLVDAVQRPAQRTLLVLSNLQHEPQIVATGYVRRPLPGACDVAGCGWRLRCSLHCGHGATPHARRQRRPERPYAGQSQQRISPQIELPCGLAGEDPRDPPLQLQSFVDRRKGNFGKHENSLTDLWRPSYSPQSGMTKCYFRSGNSSAARIRASVPARAHIAIALPWKHS
jgi:hypothetical protein